MFESRPAVTAVTVPAAHATTHVTGGTDVVANAVDGGAAGLMTGANVTKLASIAAGADVTAAALLAVLTADVDLLTRSSGALARLPKGTGAQVLRMTADATAHEHATLTASDVGADVAGAAAAALAAAEAYADALANGLDPKGSVYAAEGPSTDDTPGANVTRSGSQAVGGVVVPDGRRVALMAETDPADNGLWLTNDAGAWARTSDADASAELTTGAHVFVEAGTYAGREYLLTTTGTIVPGTTPQTWVCYRKMQLSDAAPQPLGVAAAGSAGQAARGDHVHLAPTAADVGADAVGTAAAALAAAVAHTVAGLAVSTDPSATALRAALDATRAVAVTIATPPLTLANGAAPGSATIDSGDVLLAVAAAVAAAWDAPAGYTGPSANIDLSASIAPRAWTVYARLAAHGGTIDTYAEFVLRTVAGSQRYGVLCRGEAAPAQVCVYDNTVGGATVYGATNALANDGTDWIGADVYPDGILFWYGTGTDAPARHLRTFLYWVALTTNATVYPMVELAAAQVGALPGVTVRWDNLTYCDLRASV